MTDQEIYIVTALTSSSGKIIIKSFMSKKRAIAYKEQREYEDRNVSPSFARSYGIDIGWINKDLDPDEAVIIRDGYVS